MDIIQRGIIRADRRLTVGQPRQTKRNGRTVMKGRGNTEKLSESGQRSSRRQFRVQCSLPVQNPQIRRGRSSSGKLCPRPYLVFLGTAVTLLLNIIPLLWSFGCTGRENNFTPPHRSTEYREERDGEGEESETLSGRPQTPSPPGGSWLTSTPSNCHT